MHSDIEIDEGRNRERRQTAVGRARQPLTLALVVGATVFGMVLAGGFDLTPSGFAQESEATMVKVEPVGGLPGFADLADAVSPAVVSIQAVKIERGPQGRGGDPFEFSSALGGDRPLAPTVNAKSKAGARTLPAAAS